MVKISIELSDESLWRDTMLRDLYDVTGVFTRAFNLRLDPTARNVTPDFKMNRG